MQFEMWNFVLCFQLFIAFLAWKLGFSDRNNIWQSFKTSLDNTKSCETLWEGIYVDVHYAEFGEVMYIIKMKFSNTGVKRKC